MLFPPGFRYLVPDEDRPLLALHRHCRFARGPDEVLVSRVGRVIASTLKVVRDTIDDRESFTWPVVPLQDGVRLLEPVRDQLLLIPGLSHIGRLPVGGICIHDHDPRLEY
jgi:hypothetical protein